MIKIIQVVPKEVIFSPNLIKHLSDLGNTPYLFLIYCPVTTIDGEMLNGSIEKISDQDQTFSSFSSDKKQCHCIKSCVLYLIYGNQNDKEMH